MTVPQDRNDDGSTRLGDDRTVGRHAPDASGTRTGAEMHDRMTGMQPDTTRGMRTDDDRELSVEHRVVPERIKSAKTSAAATFGLVFGLAALFCALTAILSPAAVAFGVIGLILSIVGMKMAKRMGVTGKGVAIGGLVTSLLGLLLGGAVLAGAAVLVNDQARLDQLQQFIDDARQDAPATEELIPN